MAYLIILYLIFLMTYIVFNGYIIHRVWEMRIEGDKTQVAILVYTVSVSVIIISGFIILSAISLGA